MNIVRLLARRASVPGVISSEQVGVTVFALHRLDALNLHSVPLLQVIANTTGAADARSCANVLHALACTARDVLDPHVALDEPLRHTLRKVQDHLLDLVDDLTAPESILASEAMIRLVPFGSGCLQPRLQQELQERCAALVSVVERPVELIGLLRVATEMTQSPVFAQTVSDGLGGGGGGGLEWSQEMLMKLTQTIEGRLDSFTKQDYITLLDTVTLRVPGSAASAGTGSSFSTTVDDSDHEETTTRAAGAPRQLLDASRPLVFSVLDTVESGYERLSPSQSVAWLVRLVQLQMHSHGLFTRVLQRLSDPATQSALSPSQLGAATTTLATLLQRLDLSAYSRTRQSSSPWWSSGADAAASGVSGEAIPGSGLGAPTPTEVDTMVMLLSSLFATLVRKVESAGRDSPEAVTMGHMQLYPLLTHVPEPALTGFAKRYATTHSAMSSATLAPSVVHSDPARALLAFSTSLERASALLLRHFAALSPREKADLLSTVLHWNVYGVAAAGAGRRREATGDQMASTWAEVMPATPSLTVEQHARKLTALCGLVQQWMASFNTIDMVQVLNELAAALYAEQGSFGTEGGRSAGVRALSTADTSVPAVVTPESAVQSMRAAALALHARVQQAPHRERLAELHTSHLTRYLTSMSKLNIRVTAPYHTVLGLLKDRHLTPFEQIAVLGVMARHHLQSPSFVNGVVVRGLEEVAGVLQPRQKALLLKSLGQVNGQRFVRAPVFAPLDAGAFFRSKEEVSQLTTLEAVMVVNGLVSLRQYQNETLRWVLAGPLRSTPSSLKSTSSDNVAERSLSSPSSSESSCGVDLFGIHSATTLATLVASLSRLGGPQNGVPLPLLSAAVETLRARITTSRSLFVDLAQLTWYWPVLSRHTTLLSEVEKRGEECGTAQDVADFTEQMALLTETTAALVRARLLDIARSPQLRVNSFLCGQLACAILVGGMPDPGSEDEARLVRHLELRHTRALHDNSRGVVEATVVGAFLSPRYSKEGQAMLNLVLMFAGALEAQDALMVWSVVSDALRGGSGPESTLSASDKQLLTSIREVVQTTVLKDGNLPKLSPQETRLKDRLVWVSSER